LATFNGNLIGIIRVRTTGDLRELVDWSHEAVADRPAVAAVFVIG